MVKWWPCLLLASVALAQENSKDEYQYKSPVPAGNAFLAEHFDVEDVFKEKWISSEAKKDGAEADIAKYDGEFQVEAPEGEHRLKGDMGMVLKTKARHHAISASLNRPFLFDHRPLIVQYEVQFQNGMECGGAYLKLLTQPTSGTTQALQKNFNDKTLYSIMFGPDKCGTQQKLHFIFQHKNPKTGAFEEKHWKQAHNAGGAMAGKFLDVFTDKKSHQYTLIVNPDNTFEIKIDGRTEAKGHLLEDFDPPVNPPKEIEDTEDKKPEDWDEREKIPDPEAQKPEDWDEDEPKEIEDPKAEKPIGWLDDENLLIPDPEAAQPKDWDEDMDGIWEAPLVDNPKCKDVGCGEWKPPMINNPKFKGKWRAPMIDNPAYKGKWKPRNIPNPDFFQDLNPFRLQPIVAVGFELWSMSDGILFDNILVTDDKAVVSQWSEDGFQTKRRMLDKSGASFFSTAFASFVDYSTQYPWLWAIYVLAIGVPVALLISYCFSSKTPSHDDEPAKRKKSDLEEVQEEEEEEEEEEDEQQHQEVEQNRQQQQPEEEEEEEEESVEEKQEAAAAAAGGDHGEAKLDEEPESPKEETTSESPKAKAGAAVRRRKARKE